MKRRYVADGNICRITDAEAPGKGFSYHRKRYAPEPRKTLLEQRWDGLRTSRQLAVLLLVVLGLTALTVELMS